MCVCVCLCVCECAWLQAEVADSIFVMISKYRCFHAHNAALRQIADNGKVWLQEEVVSLSAQLQQLRDQFHQKTSEQLDLKAKADLMERRLTAASKLIAGLSSERIRWTADMQVALLHHLTLTLLHHLTLTLLHHLTLTLLHHLTLTLLHHLTVSLLRHLTLT